MRAGRAACRSWLLVACALWLAACETTTTTTASWKDPTFGARRFASMLVMHVDDDALARRKYEDSVVAALAARGVRAAASYRLIPGDGKLREEQIDEAIASHGFEAVLVAHVLGVEEETVHYPGYYRSVPRPVFHHYYRAYTYYYDLVYHPPYTATFTTMSMETSVYQAPSGRVVWSMRTRSLDPDALDRLVSSVVRETIDNLASSALIGG